MHVLGSLLAYRPLVLQMARRDVLDRYRGSILGFLWSIFNPMFMLLIYTFVFAVVMRATWPGTSGGSLEYAMNVFAGLIVFSFFSEVVSRAPTLVVGNANLVKKVVFPLEVLPWVMLASSLFHAAMSFLVLLMFVFVVKGSLPVTILLFPLVLVPVALLALGLAWALSSLGVFFRDMSHTVGLLMAAWMFMSPIFYPLATVPEPARRWLMLNPLARPIEDARLLMHGMLPEPVGYVLLVAGSLLAAWVGIAWFMRTKHAFADVL
jgi:lipopolysaccharide transport system permease protein